LDLASVLIEGTHYRLGLGIVKENAKLLLDFE